MPRDMAKKRAYDQEYRKSHREEVLARSSAYYWSHRDEARKRSAKYRADHYEKLRIAKKEYTKTHGEQARARQLVRVFGISAVDYQSLLDKQNGECAVCGSRDPGSKRVKRFFVDHNHDTGKVRGLLCCNCNVAVGMLKDSVGRAYAIAKYLESQA